MLFLVTFLLLYAVMHIYFISEVWAADVLPSALLVPAIALLIVMWAAPLMLRIMERKGLSHRLGRVGAIGNGWMAVLMWFCSLSLVVDLWNASVRFASRVNPLAGKLLVPQKIGLAMVLALVLAAVVAGIIEATRIRTRQIIVKTGAMPAGELPVRIVQISDVQLMTHNSAKVASRIADAVAELDPDILVSTGDMVDTTPVGMGEAADILNGIKPRLGKYAVLGNHEYFAGLTGSLAFHERAGFKLLREKSVRVAPQVVLAGVDDRIGPKFSEHSFCNEEAVLRQVADDRAYKILLKHRPQVHPGSLGLFDLQLSGHTHGGQVFPFHFLCRRQCPILSGLHRLHERSHLYVSRGAGTTGPALRLFAPAEVCLITIEPVLQDEPEYARIRNYRFDDNAAPITAGAA